MREEKMRKWLFLLLVGGMLGLTVNRTQAQDISKYQAVFLYNFTKYIQWPDQNGTIVIGVMGNSDVYQELLKSIKAKNIKSIQVNKLESAEEARQCDLVYLAQSLSGSFNNLLTETHNHHVLIVTEDESLAEAGAAISFYFENNQLRFKINEKAVQDRNITMSSQLLALGHTI